MPLPPPPFVIPSTLEFYWNDESSLTRQIAVYNPFTYDISYKVDNARPRKYSLSIRQGVIAAQKKLFVEISCREQEAALDDKIQFRFFKMLRPQRPAAKPRAHQYIGFREVKLSVYHNHGERERTPSTSSELSIGASSGITADLGASPGSLTTCPHVLQQQQLHHLPGDPKAVETLMVGHHRSQRLQVLMNLGVTVILLLLGFLLNKTDPDWFSSNIVEGIQPHTLSVIFYTLACVLIIKLLTFR